jgi:hypothetical protein
MIANLPSSFVNWFVGYFDAKGTLLINREVIGRGGQGLSFRLRDKGINRFLLLIIQEALGFGNVYPKVDPGSTSHRVWWQSAKLADCVFLCNILDVHGLRSYKRYRYKVWAKMVREISQAKLHDRRVDTQYLKALMNGIPRGV